MAAACAANLMADSRALTYSKAAEDLRTGMAEHLWDEESGRFVRRLVSKAPDDTGADYSRDMTIDSAVHAVWAFGAFAPDDPRVRSTMKSALTRLWVRTEVGGVARYEDDYYFRRVADIDNVPGNPWIICTLWAAQWYIAQAATRAELATALDILLWACERAGSTGILPEQVHPETGEHLSVSPLTWSHAEFVSTVLDYAEKFKSLAD